ncbi:hypothetical protein DFQ29_006737 [Apophysomyces sp. BC1021]|nr:hypothetical protein DFQ29_006737 [Apophysomyces sp. BC1021]
MAVPYQNNGKDILAQSDGQKSQQTLFSVEKSLKYKLKKSMVGFLTLNRVTWQSSAEVLEKIYRYEAVHAVADWQDLKRRLGPDRRVFAFFFHNLPTEPLVFVHVALVPNMSDSVQAILQEPLPAKYNPTDFKCAICYSITTQRGLGGVNLGNFLIKRVVRDLKREFPQINTFATLSPLPGFKKWLMSHVYEPDIQKQFEEAAGRDWKYPISIYVMAHVHTNYIGWRIRQARTCTHLMILGAHFFVADKGLQESFGIMINYNYLPDYVEINNRQYLADGTISISEPRSDRGGWLSNCIGPGIKHAKRDTDKAR